ncbi:hypothetical protein HJC23_009071 [Cyclotella cryptica]|uniref:Serine aminopeptidase S33 domain-containing protein n=1 Tax=Cyclotella cryptica TaxID=29204 RepID=A0ABD3QZA9_9STRA|eukprot:CCRYP_000685-RA/>CCRYP_000685-RA protein AED:0.03 eAED:0.03 QI:735/1/1/1/1/1/2/365/628
MGDTISSLVFRPPKPTPIDPNDYFYLDVDITSPLYFRKQGSYGGTGSGVIGGAGLGSMMMCGGDDSDLISLDRGFLDADGLCVSEGMPHVGLGCSTAAAGGAATLNDNPRGTDKVKYKIPAFYVRRRGAKHTVLFSHGNAEDLGMMYKRMKDLALVLCVNVMAYDYTGYGLSICEAKEEEGTDCGEFVVDGNNSVNGVSKSGANAERNVPSENMIYRNIEAAYAYLTQTRNIPPRNIILYGRSLGSGPSCYLAAKTALMGESVGGLILHSPFLSVYKVVADVWGMDVRGDMFNNEKRAGNVRCPTLIIHGKQDEVVPFWHAPRLLAAIPPEFRAHPFYVDNLGHNHIESKERSNYIQAITEFLMKFVPPVDDDSGNNTGALDRWLHFNNSRQRTSSFSQGKTQQTDIHVNVIPEHERATEDELKQSDTSFYINQTWMRHAKVICAEVFSDNIICNSALTVADWSSGGSREGGGSCKGNSGPSGKGSNSSDAAKQKQGGDKYACYDDARDDEDEFSPWTMDREGRQEQQHVNDKIYMSRQGSTNNNNNPSSTSKFKRSQSEVLNRDAKMNEMVVIHQPQKKPPSMSKYSSKSSSMPTSMETGAHGMKIKMSSSTRRRNGGRGSFLGFRK